MPGYRSRILASLAWCLVGEVRHPRYPIMQVEEGDRSIFLEGWIYGKPAPAIRQDLLGIMPLALGDREDSSGQMADWLLNADGEFVVVFLDKAGGKAAILLDALGHLPLYWHRQQGTLVASRGLSCVARLMDAVAFERTAIMHQLLFRFALGETCLLRNVSRAEPGSLIRFDAQRGAVEVRRVHAFVFDGRQHAGKSVRENCDRLAELFLEACRSRADLSGQSRNVIALSGGVDSRMVGAGLRACSVPARAVTFHEAHQPNHPDVRIAQALSRILGFEWRAVVLKPPVGADYLQLLRIKAGANYLGMAFFLPFLEEVLQQHGPEVTLFTGDTGLALRCSAPPRKPKDLKALAEILLWPAIFSSKQVAALIDCKASEVTRSVLDHLEAYPEKALENKYVRFWLYANVHNWYHEGMDRDRFFCRLGAPLESLPVFLYASQCPEEQKDGFRYFREVIGRYSPQSAALPHSLFGRLGTTGFAFRYWAWRRYVTFPTSVRTMAKAFLRRKSERCHPGLTIVRCMQDQIANCASVRQYLPGLSSALANTAFTRRQMLMAFTVSSALEWLETGRSSIERYSGCQLL